jgi:hypothetical protein
MIFKTSLRLHTEVVGGEITAVVERSTSQVYAINYKTMEYKGQLTGRLKISVVSTGEYIMSYFLSDFMKENNGLKFIINEGNIFFKH